MLPDRRPTFYILKEDYSIRATKDAFEWTKAFETMDRRVARTEVAPDVVVSTVFIGHDLGSPPDSGGEPVVFETRVFTDYGEPDGDGTKRLRDTRRSSGGCVNASKKLGKKRWDKVGDLAYVAPTALRQAQHVTLGSCFEMPDVGPQRTENPGFRNASFKPVSSIMSPRGVPVPCPSTRPMS